MNHILILDIGKTNKKAFVFDEDYRIIFETSTQLPETTDDDGHPCEDIALLNNWILDTTTTLLHHPDFSVKAINCTTYGASFVHLDKHFQPITPLYNYLKPFPPDLLEWFLKKYGGQEKLCLETASPLLGHLNSGLQLLWLKYHKPMIFNKIKHSLHLPQWATFSISDVGFAISAGPAPKSQIRHSTFDMTSLGCHTMLWDFQKNDYHEWVKTENLLEKLSYPHAEIRNRKSEIGTGLHDSSAALIPYLASFREPFVLISTGTWCISLNPFNHEPLTAEELGQDCLCYLTAEGKPVKAARYFGGNEHEQAVKKIADEYGVSTDFYKKENGTGGRKLQAALKAYDDFMQALVKKQAASTRLAIGHSPVRRIFVDGGFSKNERYMRLLAAAFPEMEIFAAEVAQATALGAAMSMHRAWNEKPLPTNLIACKHVNT